MNKKSVSQSAFVNLRVLLSIALFTGTIVAALFAAAVDGRTRRGDISPIGLGRESAIVRSAERKTSSEVPAGSAQWLWQRPLPQGNPLYAVSLPDGVNGIAVG